MIKKEIKIRKVTDLEIQNLANIKERIFNAVCAYLLETHKGIEPGDTVHLTIDRFKIEIPIDNYVFEKMQQAKQAFNPLHRLNRHL